MTEVLEFKATDYKSDLKPVWCPGCGDFGVLNALHRAIADGHRTAARGRAVR